MVSDDVEKGKMIEDENIEETKVEWKVYKQYIKYAGGWFIYLLPHICIVIFVTTKMIGDLYVGYWAYDPH